MVFRWAAALCESMKPKSARLAGPAVAVAVGADTVVAAAAVETAAVQTEVAVAVVVRAAGKCLKA
jgi:hypothetical protein